MSQKIRIYNITSFLKFPGFGIDFDGHYLAPNPDRPLIVEVAVVPQILEDWQARRWIKIQAADDKTPVTKESEAAVTPGTQVNEVASVQVDALNDELDEDIFNFDTAKEASLTADSTPGPAPMQSIRQMQTEEELVRSRVKVSLGTSDKPGMADSVSPIPGDRPRSVDNSEAFTVRAPRHTGPGAVVKSS
jgi:hypothetical protein